MSSQHFNHLLKDLGKSVGLSELQASKEGLCSLRFDDRITVDMECSQGKGVLIFSSIVGALLPEQSKDFHLQLLEANLLWSGTGGATLGVDPTTQTVFLCYQEKIEDLDFLRFQDLLKGFSNVAPFWNQHLTPATDAKKKKSSTSKVKVSQ